MGYVVLNSNCDIVDNQTVTGLGFFRSWRRTIRHTW